MNLSEIHTLPEYHDDEVKVFHPLCEHALHAALKQLGLDQEFEVKHHEMIGTLEADFALIRKSTKKYVLFVEVKRTAAAVSSTRYRIQAQSYVQEARSAVEKPYYAITNLEVLDLFKYDASRLSVAQQIIEPSPLRIGTFADDPSAFMRSLVHAFEQMISIAVQDLGTYKELTGSFIPLLESHKANQAKWHQSLIVAGYEYIRGVLKGSKREMPWRSAFNYKNRPGKLIENMQALNFHSLSQPPLPLSKDDELWNTAMLEDLEELGQKTMSGDEMAELVHSIAVSGREHEGLVPTDLELAQVLSVLSRHVLGRDLHEHEVICDPAAGSGNLLSAGKFGFENLQPKQLWANDKEPLFAELLSIRLGLMFPTVIAPDNSPKVTVQDAITLERADFEPVKVVLMNPPYVSGVKDPVTKRKVAARIHDLNGQMSLTNIGQVGIEAPFVEMINSLVPEGTVISVVLPKQYLTTPGREASAFRSFLLHEFGLQLIFLYPRSGIFQDVIKDTVVLIGRKPAEADIYARRTQGIAPAKVQVIKSELPLAHLNLAKLKMSLATLKQGKAAASVPSDQATNTAVGLPSEQATNPAVSLAYGVDLREIAVKELDQKREAGWRNLTVIGEQSEAWIRQTLVPLSKKISERHMLKRGRIGNAGASDLLFINTNAKLWDRIQGIVPADWLYPALRTVKEIDYAQMNAATTSVRFLAPCDQAFQAGTVEYDILEEILDHYLVLQAEAVGQAKQRKKEKTKEELRKIIDKERKKVTPSHTILIPRNIRRFARAFITTEDAYISTNVIEVSGGTVEERQLTHSWLLSVFAQLQFEAMAKDQEGARKLEENSIGELLIPNTDQADQATVDEWIASAASRTEFLDLCEPKSSDLDVKWAKWIDHQAPAAVLNQAVQLLEERVRERYPEYSPDDRE